MPLTLKGKSKARLEIQWEGHTPVHLNIVPSTNKDVILYKKEIMDTGRYQIELNELDFQELPDVYEVELMALVKEDDEFDEEISNLLQIQKCHHEGCQEWGHARKDGYCKHCGRRIRGQSYSYGFPKLELTHFVLPLWNGLGGQLWKKKEAKEYNNGIYSIGKYEDKFHKCEQVEIIEEKFDQSIEKRFIQLNDILVQADLLNKLWKLPLASFQEENKRTIWIYYPRIIKKAKWQSITALSYILNSDVDLLSIPDIIQVGIQLCKIARKLRNLGYIWGGAKLNDLVLYKVDQQVNIYLRSKNIAWNNTLSKELLNSCLVPWELFCDTNHNLGEVSEIYIIGIILYLLRAKAPNLLTYNSISFPYGLPTLKLFKPALAEKKPEKDIISDHFESVINKALLLNPQERGYSSLHDFELELNSLLDAPYTPNFEQNYLIDPGFTLDIGDEKCEDDFSKNQDAVFMTTYSLKEKKWGMFVLCDGISTATVGRGDQASRIVINTFRRWWKVKSEDTRKKVCEYASTNIAKAKEFLSDLINDANKKICHEAKKIADQEIMEKHLVMGSTITVGLIHDGVIFFGWLGDSPIYRFSSFGWEKLNFEDNERNFRIINGMPLDECFIEDGNALTRCVGAHFYSQNNLQMHFGYTYLYPNEHILICSDGIPDYIEQEATYARQENYQMLRVASILEEYGKDKLINSKALSSILISSVNQIGGGYDNLSAILISTLFEEESSFENSYKRLNSLRFKLNSSRTNVNEETTRGYKTLRIPR